MGVRQRQAPTFNGMGGWGLHLHVEMDVGEQGARCRAESKRTEGDDGSSVAFVSAQEVGVWVGGGAYQSQRLMRVSAPRWMMPVSPLRVSTTLRRQMPLASSSPGNPIRARSWKLMLRVASWS